MSREIGSFIISSDMSEIKVAGKWRSYKELVHAVQIFDKAKELLKGLNNEQK